GGDERRKRRGRLDGLDRRSLQRRLDLRHGLRRLHLPAAPEGGEERPEARGTRAEPGAEPAVLARAVGCDLLLGHPERLCLLLRPQPRRLDACADRRLRCRLAGLAGRQEGREPSHARANAHRARARLTLCCGAEGAARAALAGELLSELAAEEILEGCHHGILTSW